MPSSLNVARALRPPYIADISPAPSPSYITVPTVCLHGYLPVTLSYIAPSNCHALPMPYSHTSHHRLCALFSMHPLGPASIHARWLYRRITSSATHLCGPSGDACEKLCSGRSAHSRIIILRSVILVRSWLIGTPRHWFGAVCESSHPGMYTALETTKPAHLHASIVFYCSARRLIVAVYTPMISTCS